MDVLFSDNRVVQGRGRFLCALCFRHAEENCSRDGSEMYPVELSRAGEAAHTGPRQDALWAVQVHWQVFQRVACPRRWIQKGGSPPDAWAIEQVCAPRPSALMFDLQLRISNLRITCARMQRWHSVLHSTPHYVLWWGVHDRRDVGGACIVLATIYSRSDELFLNICLVCVVRTRC